MPPPYPPNVIVQSVVSFSLTLSRGPGATFGQYSQQAYRENLARTLGVSPDLITYLSTQDGTSSGGGGFVVVTTELVVENAAFAGALEASLMHLEGDSSRLATLAPGFTVTDVDAPVIFDRVQPTTQASTTDGSVESVASWVMPIVLVMVVCLVLSWLLVCFMVVREKRAEPTFLYFNDPKFEFAPRSVEMQAAIDKQSTSV